MHRNSQSKEKDVEKRQACEQAGITLIEIPYWWDGQRDTLIKLIQKQVPKLGGT